MSFWREIQKAQSAAMDAAWLLRLVFAIQPPLFSRRRLAAAVWPALFSRAGFGFAAHLQRSRKPRGPQQVFPAPCLMATKPLKPCGGAVSGA